MNIDDPVDLSQAVKMLGLTRQAIHYRIKHLIIPKPIYISGHPVWERSQLNGLEKGKVKLGRHPKRLTDKLI